MLATPNGLTVGQTQRIVDAPAIGQHTTLVLRVHPKPKLSSKAPKLSSKGR